MASLDIVQWLLYFNNYVLQVRTPKKIKEPELAYKLPIENEAPGFLFGGPSKVNYIKMFIFYDKRIFKYFLKLFSLIFSNIYGNYCG